MTSIKDVARLAGVSVSTVSHVINATRVVAPETKRAVKRAIEELGYQPNSLARALKIKATRTLGMLVTSSTNPFFAEVVRGVEEGCYRRGYSLILCNSGDDRDRYLRYLDTLVSKRIDGLVVMTTSADAEVRRALGRQEALPKVLLDAPPGIDVCTVGDDSVLGGRLATAFLLERGFTEIGCLTGPDDHPRSRDRLEGFGEALRAAGIAVRPAWLEADELTATGGYRAASRLLDRGRPPQALFALNDLMALGAFHALRERGFEIPGDMSVVGYDDLEMTPYLSPPLTTVRQPSFELGLEAAAILINRLDHDAAMPPTIRLTPELIVRQSVGRRED